jgi:hypothetical protein
MKPKVVRRKSWLTRKEGREITPIEPIIKYPTVLINLKAMETISRISPISRIKFTSEILSIA